MRSLIALFALLALVLTTAAEPPPPAPNEPPPGRPGRGPDGARPRYGGPGGQMTERWMNHLRDKRPEDFERLQELRQKDPDLFRREMYVRLRREIGARLESEHPAIHDAIKNLPEPEREWLLSRLAGPDSPGPRMGDGPAFRPPDEQRDEDFSPLIRAYRQSASEAEREQTGKKLRAEIQSSLERKHRRRREELDQLEVRLRQMREQLDAREAASSALIEAKLNELTGTPTPPGS